MVKDIINECLILLDDNSLKEKIKNVKMKGTLETELTGLSETEKNTIKLLVENLKNVINSITRSYLKNYTIERIKSDNEGKITLSSLSRPVIGIKNVSDSMNNYIVYKTFFDHIKVPFSNMDFDVCYNFETEEFNSLFDEVDVPLGLTSYCLALGVVSVYYQIKLLYSEAELFESKFKAELHDIKPSLGTRSFFVWRN